MANVHCFCTFFDKHKQNVAHFENDVYQFLVSIPEVKHCFYLNYSRIISLQIKCDTQKKKFVNTMVLSFKDAANITAVFSLNPL